MTMTIHITLLMCSVKVAFVGLLQLKYVQANALKLLESVDLLVKRKDIL